MKTWKKYLIILTSIIAGTTAITSIIFACGGGDYEEWFNSFFDPQVLHNSKYEPFYRTQSSPLYTGYKENYNNQFDTINVDEWHTFFNGSVDREDLHQILYSSSLQQIDTLIFFIKDPAFPIHKNTRSNTITKVSDKKKAKEFLFYMGFARRCGAHAVRSDDWEYEEKDKVKEAAELAKLIDGGEKLLKNVKNNFIRERYFFQLTRLYFFRKDYQQCVNYYNAHKDSIKLSESLKYRSMSYAAGATKRLKKTALANFMYAQVYDQYDELKETAYFSFNPSEETDLQESVALGKTPREKCAVWHLAGIKSDPARAMENIYQLDPKSDLLELLLTRAINETEENIIPPSYYFYDNGNKDGHILYNDKLSDQVLTFITHVAGQGNTANPYLWNMSAGYLQIISGNFALADKFLTKAKQQSESDTLAAKQIKIIEVVGNVLKFKPVAANEASITPDLIWLKNTNSLRSNEAYIWCRLRLAEIYKAEGDTLKAVCLNSQIEKTYLFSNERLDRMIAYLNKNNKTAFDKFITSLYPYPVKSLYDMQGVNLLYQHMFEKAKEKFTLAGDRDLESDPFTIRLKDCRDCDQSEYGGGDTKISFINTMLNLHEEIEKNTEDKAENYFLLANGYYNMTYFGNCRSLYINDAYDPGLLSFNYDKDRIRENKFILDCSKAEEYYIKAMNASTNKEFKAKCAFMAAKCEQNAYYAREQFDSRKIIKSGKYYSMLKTTFPNTKYYQEIIKECGYFRTYVKK